MGLKSRRINRKVKNTWIITVVLWVIVVAAIIWIVWAQQHLLIPYKTVYSADYIPKSLVGTKIVHVTDINNVYMSSIVKQTSDFKPDFIILSGGYKDDNGGYNNSVKIVSELVKIAPVYYVYDVKDGKEDVLSSTGATNLTGTHITINAKQRDARTFISETYGESIIKKADKSDEKSLMYLDYVTEELDKTSGARIRIIGLDVYDYENGQYDALNYLNDVTDSAKVDYNIAIMGNIKLMPQVKNSHMDAVFTGGTYGTNNVSADITKGQYGINGTQFFVSGGVATPNGINRVLNYPEIQCITLSDGTILNRNPLEKFLDMFIDDVGTIFDNDGGFTEYTYHYGN